MISDWSQGYACQALQCNAKKLRTKDLTVIFEVCPCAVREISRYCRENNIRLADIS